jgi:Leucine-rich repeat (LRR) protein
MLALDASSNCISTIDASIRVRSGLQCLFFRDNMIDKIPDEPMAASSSLTVLDLSRNLITKIQNLIKLRRLGAVDVGRSGRPSENSLVSEINGVRSQKSRNQYGISTYVSLVIL